MVSGSGQLLFGSRWWARSFWLRINDAVSFYFNLIFIHELILLLLSVCCRTYWWTRILLTFKKSCKRSSLNFVSVTVETQSPWSRELSYRRRSNCAISLNVTTSGWLTFFSRSIRIAGWGCHETSSSRESGSVMTFCIRLYLSIVLFFKTSKCWCSECTGLDILWKIKTIIFVRLFYLIRKICKESLNEMLTWNRRIDLRQLFP